MPLTTRGWLPILAIMLPSVAFADAVMVTRAMTAGTIMEAFVDEDAIVVELEIGDQELAGFPSLVEAATSAKEFPVPIPPGSELSFVADGTRLRGSIKSAERRKKVERDEVSGEPLPTATAEEALFVVLRYPLRNQPKALVLSPPSKDGYAMPTSVSSSTTEVLRSTTSDTWPPPSDSSSTGTILSIRASNAGH